MVERVVDFVKGHAKISDIFLHVQTNNDNAMEFYKHFGFKTVHTMKNYYKVSRISLYFLS